MKRILIFAVMVFVLGAFFGCGENVKNISVKDIVASIDAEIESVSSLTATDLLDEENEMGKYVAEAYALDINLLDEAIVKAPMISLAVDEIAIIKVKDAKDIDLVKESMENRKQVQMNAFENYVPGNYEIAKNAIIKTKGNYVYLIISNEAEQIEAIIEKQFE